MQLTIDLGIVAKLGLTAASVLALVKDQPTISLYGIRLTLAITDMTARKYVRILESNGYISAEKKPGIHPSTYTILK